MPRRLNAQSDCIPSHFKCVRTFQPLSAAFSCFQPGRVGFWTVSSVGSVPCATTFGCGRAPKERRRKQACFKPSRWYFGYGFEKICEDAMPAMSLESLIPWVFGAICVVFAWFTGCIVHMKSARGPSRVSDTLFAARHSNSLLGAQHLAAFQGFNRLFGAISSRGESRKRPRHGCKILSRGNGRGL